MRSALAFLLLLCNLSLLAKDKAKELNWQTGTLVDYQELKDGCDQNRCLRRTTYVVDTGTMLYSFTRHGDPLRLTVNTPVKYSTDDKIHGKSWLMDENGKAHDVTILEKRANSVGNRP